MADIDPILHLIQPGSVGVEIGVSEGISAEAILAKGVDFLHLVDPWEPYQEITSHLEMQLKLQKCLERVRRFQGHYAIHRMLSSQFYWRHRLPQFNFVWIDGDHKLEAARRDIKYFWETVLPGGVLCGHDYTNNETCQVKQAVDEFARERGLYVENVTPCWVIRK